MERFQLPFDLTQNGTTQVSIVNPNGGRATIGISLRDENGKTLGSESIGLSPRSRTSFTLTQHFPKLVNTRGFVEFSSPGMPVSATGLQVNSRGTATTVPAIVPAGAALSAAARTVSEFLDGGNWKTTFALVNTGSDPAPVSIILRQPDGTVSPTTFEVKIDTGEYSDVIPPGGSRFLGTAGTASSMSIGWVEIVTPGNVEGVAIYRNQPQDGSESDTAVAIKHGGRRKFVIPVDNTKDFLTTIALVNPDTAQVTSLTILFRDENGQPVLSDVQKLGPRDSWAFSVMDQYPALKDWKGVAEFASPKGDIVPLGLRFSGRGSFTLMDTLAK